MHFTVFNTPVIKQIFQIISIIILKFAGWKFISSRKLPDKAVVIAAPHTTNWDFFYTILMAFKVNLKICWMGKESLFKGPGGWFLRWLGGIPVDRSKANNLVSATAEKFKQKKKLTVIIPPEGTRSKVNSWKTGFYYTAYLAEVPIIMGFLDFKNKVGGLGPAFAPTGDIENDMEIIKGFYKNITGKYPEKTDVPAVNPGEVKLVPHDELVDKRSFVLTPTGDIENDLLMIQAFYAYMVNSLRPGTFAETC